MVSLARKLLPCVYVLFRSVLLTRSSWAQDLPIIFIRCLIIFDKTYLDQFHNPSDAEGKLKQLIYQTNFRLYDLPKKPFLVLVGASVNYEEVDHNNLTQALQTYSELTERYQELIDYHVAIFVARRKSNISIIHPGYKYAITCAERPKVSILLFLGKEDDVLDSYNLMKAILISFLHIKPDTDFGDKCCPSKSCHLYSESEITFPSASFSQCTSRQLDKSFGMGFYSCLLSPSLLIKPGLCGNKILEAGEDCDCKTECSECIETTCKFRPSAVTCPTADTHGRPDQCSPCAEHSALFKGYVFISIVVGIFGVIVLISGYVTFRGKV